MVPGSSTTRPALATRIDWAVLLENCWHCAVENCAFRNIGGYAVCLHLDSCLNRIAGNKAASFGQRPDSMHRFTPDVPIIDEVTLAVGQT